MKTVFALSRRSVARLAGAALCSAALAGAMAGEVSPPPSSGMKPRSPSIPAFSAARALSEQRLANHRAGSATSVVGLDGSLQQTTAVDVQTGANTIREGSFANALGLTTVIQNSGANVLIQNATTVNVQFK